VRSVSIVPDIGQVPAGRLSTFNYRAFKTRMKNDLAAAGVDRYFLALDASFDHVKGSRLRGHWQLHFWGVVLDGSFPRIDELKKLMNESDRVDRPVWISPAPIQPRSIRAVVAYAVKSRFDRREKMLKTRPGRRPFWDTQSRPLLGLPLIELMVFLDNIGPHGRLLTKGVDFEALQRARAIRAAKRRPRPRRKVDGSRRPEKGGARH
jgi:hypothetical protein